MILGAVRIPSIRCGVRRRCDSYLRDSHIREMSAVKRAFGTARWMAAALISMSACFSYGQTSQTFESPASQRAFLEQYCSLCHNDEKKFGGMTLTRLNVEHIEQTAELAEKMIRKLRVGMMPPPGMKRPDAATRKAFVTALEASVDKAAAAQPYAGRPALHRLNRTEYANSIRDLLSIQVDVSALLPPDDMSHGFDNMADVLTVSSTLTDAYMRAADKIARAAVGDPSSPPITSTYTVPKIVSQDHHVEGTPFGTRGGIALTYNFPADGDYVFKLRFYHHATGALFGMNQGKTQQVDVALTREKVALLEIDPAHSLGGIKTSPIKVKAGPQLVSASFIQRADGPREDEIRLVEQSLVDLTIGAVPGISTLPHLLDLSITGPLHVSGISETPSRRRIFICRPTRGASDVPCATKIISTLARRAFRRPVTDTDLKPLLGFYRLGKSQGGFEAGIRTAVQAIIASPEFVFRFERTLPGGVRGPNYNITDLELASRLSYFLWSSGPDDRLITIASQGRLSTPRVLEREVRRMLADRRSEALSTNFVDQWLHLRNLKDATPDLYIYPDFDKTLTQSMQRETELLFNNIKEEDRSVLDLLTADFTFVNDRLARHYGIPNVTGTRFRRVKISDENRRGLLGQAGILMLTSTANRTSPVKRGKYVMEVLLGTPPPPPPPNVPALPENAEARTGHVAKPLSVRERMQEHRNNPACAGCHKLMDPIGFALENFDGVGKWRTRDSGFQIDASGQMFDGTKLDGPPSLREAVLSHSDAFIATFSENLLAYALGRVIDYRDLPVTRSIQHQAATDNYRFSSFILAIVKSPAFRMRSFEETPPAGTRIALIQPKR